MTGFDESAVELATLDYLRQPARTFHRLRCRTPSLAGRAAFLDFVADSDRTGRLLALAARKSTAP